MSRHATASETLRASRDHSSTRCQTPTPDDDGTRRDSSYTTPSQELDASLSVESLNSSSLKRTDSVETLRGSVGPIRNPLRRALSTVSLNTWTEPVLSKRKERVPEPDDIPEIPDEDEDKPCVAWLPQPTWTRRRVPLSVPYGPWLTIPSSLRVERGLQCLTRQSIIPERFNRISIKPPLVTPEYEAALLQRVKLAKAKIERIELGADDLYAEVLMYEKFHNVWLGDLEEDE